MRAVWSSEPVATWCLSKLECDVDSVSEKIGSLLYVLLYHFVSLSLSLCFVLPPSSLSFVLYPSGEKSMARTDLM